MPNFNHLVSFMIILNRTVFDIPFTWNRIRFEATRNNRRVARKLIEISIDVQFEKQMRGVFSHNIEIEENINDLNERLSKCHEKLRVLDNMIELASQSLRTYFDKRMESVRAIVQEHCHIIQEIIREEDEHWKEIHAVMDQNLLNPGDIRSRTNYPRSIQKSPAPNIGTIDEEEDEEHVSKLLNGKTLTPLLTQMIRKSRLQSKRLTLIPSIKVHLPVDQENSVPRNNNQLSMHIIPLSTTRQPLDIVDTTFVVKPEDTMVDNDDEPNGTYRAPNPHFHSHLRVSQRETSLIDSQPNIPARLCFSPTILQDATALQEENGNEESSSDNENNQERFKTILLRIDQNRTILKKHVDDNRRFGQTFLLDIVKTEQIDGDQNNYMRPTIPDDDVLIIVDDNSFKNKPHTTNSSLPIPQNSSTVQETVKPKSRSRIPTRTKSKPVVLSARKTRSAAKVIAEREAAAAAAAVAKVPMEKPVENKRKTRKRKQSKSIDRPPETSEDENPSSNSTHTVTNRRKAKKRKKSRVDHHSPDTSDDENLASNTVKRRTRKRNDRQQEMINENATTKRKTTRLKEREMSDHEKDKTIRSKRRKKSKISSNDSEEKQTKVKKRRQKSKKTKKDDEEQASKQHSTGSSAQRNHRPD